MASENVETMTYFAHLIQDKPIRLGRAEGKGKALFAATRFTAGQAIFREKPFVAMQHRANRRTTQGCDNCFKVLGTVEEQLAVMLQVGTDAIPTVPNALKDSSAAPTQILTCPCGEVYCSLECQVAAWERYHCLLCAGHPDTPMQAFVDYSTETNEIFLLAAQVICSIIVRYAKSQDMVHARRPVDVFCKLPWWEVVAVNAELEDGQTLEEYCDIFKNLLAHTLSLFLDGLRFNVSHIMLHDNHPDPDSSFMATMDFDHALDACEAAGVLTLDFFANVVGMFEMNNISLEIRHPLNELAEERHKSGHAQVATWLSTISATIQAKLKLEHEGDNDDDDDDQVADWDFPDLDGTALYSLICMMNHSCDPNVAVTYETGEATVVAIQDIGPGDELCIAYIDTDVDVDERRAQLSEYHFECACPRCKDELAQ
ncbi:hypothetical protein, variant [Aphanomyces invadans]|uniref:SET domain-containing protein n=1 Tax=Aphanomyces invadans TaxID=157072 RepID=A0A024TLC5_9STRA|nr:hypothetical protein, variant [Aphanomyces invadans]ETV94809.1 hypothetical protein, variant [Aphanomyces invadans]|eukprot:XP_008876400.1 hypothetical protein, variant [Aphanomyces invadans]